MRVKLSFIVARNLRDLLCVVGVGKGRPGCRPGCDKERPHDRDRDLAANLGTICTLLAQVLLPRFCTTEGSACTNGVRGRMKRDLEELWRLEQICLAEAAPATMHIERIGLLKVAEDCRRSADEIEARAALQSRARSFLGVSWGYPGYADTNWPGHVGVRSDRLGAVRRALSSLVSRSRVHHKGPPVHAGGFLSLTLNAAEGPSVYRTGDSFADRRCFMDLTW